MIQTLTHGSNIQDFEYGILPQTSLIMRITGAGRLQVLNTGGSSAGDGGMGSGSTDDREKGDLTSPGEKGGTSTKEEEGFDPIKKNVQEKERENEANS